MSFAVRYMGSKRSLAPLIADKIHDRHPKAAVLDAFAGMGAVGAEVAPHHVLLTNDIHAFAEVASRASFVCNGPRPTSMHVKEDLLKRYRKNLKALNKIFERRLKLEDVALAEVDEVRSWTAFKDYTVGEQQKAVPIRSKKIGPLGEYRSESTKFPYCLFSTYYSNAYFGLRQSIEIDSLRYAISHTRGSKHSHYLYALMKAVSHCVSAPGHFAQFLVPRDRRNTAYIARIRNRSIYARFLTALDDATEVDCLRSP